MAQRQAHFAHFDRSQPAPYPVIGWYDCVLFHYKAMPADAELLILTLDEWNARLLDPSGWAVTEDDRLLYIGRAGYNA